MFEKNKPLADLATVTWKKQLGFALLVFERMLPSLITFSNDGALDPSCYLQGRDAAWAALQNDKSGINNQSLKDACVKNTPDTEQFCHELTSYALNAALTMVSILEFTADRRFDHISYISSLATDSVDLYLSGIEPSVVYFPKQGRRAAAHPLMQRELHRQEDDIHFVSELPDYFDDETISALKARASSQPLLLPKSMT